MKVGNRDYVHLHQTIFVMNRPIRAVTSLQITVNNIYIVYSLFCILFGWFVKLNLI